MVEIELAGRPLVLLADKAAYLPDERCLLIADAHVGKAVSFRKLGVPVPRGTTTAGLTRVSALARATGAQQVVFLGDFLHSEHSHAASTLAALAQWRREQPQLALTLVRGNHDDRAGDPPPALGFCVVDEPLPLGGFALCHHPRALPGAYVLAGHWHPCVSVGGRAFDRLRLPCFWFGEAVGVLPAFGEFTGMHPIRPAEGDQVYAVAEGQVVRLP
ncbi:ligase-associated DNA damage response endonuclease PdeM [Methylibium rhizosphaerae]|uniref:ligase-associated DNA damage response endonuclease PdeM n=1 Tax=Methylibium rhizosphaerae TaxID=2570323 RepID=UPI00112E2291|nr:ligase-associated DNA damage response endonuclease PdeM [Methylibium rhizosphaerae]